MSIKDSQKAYELTTNSVRVFNSRGKLVCWGTVDEISHFSVFRDYTIHLKGGGKVVIDPDIIKMIVDHEKEELGNIK